MRGPLNVRHSQKMKITLLFFLMLAPSLVYGLSVNSIHIITGTYTSGNEASTENTDSDYYIVEEVATVDALDVRFNFSVPDPDADLYLEFYGYYEGNPAHEVNVSYWDGSAWVVLWTLPDALGPTLYNSSIPAGTRWIRFKHVQTGSANHFLNVDYLNILEVKTELDPLNWFYMASWVAILAVGYLFKKAPAVIIGSIYGLWIALQFYAISPFITLVFLVLNIYTVYNGLENWDG